MAMANKVVRCVASFSRAPLSPAATLQKGLTAHLRRRFTSSSGKHGRVAVGVDVGNRRINASNFMNKTRLKPAEVSVGNGLMADVTISPSTSIFKQTAIMDMGSRPIYLDTGSNDVLVKYMGGFHKSGKHILAWQMEPKCVLDLCRQLQNEGYDITYPPVKSNSLINMEHLEKEIRQNPALISIMTVNNEVGVIQQMEVIRKLYRKQGVFFHTNGSQAVGRIPVEADKWNVSWVSVSGAKVYGPKRIGACYIRCGLKVRIGPPIPGGGQEHGLHCGTLAHSFMMGFGEERRIAQEGTEYTRTSEPFFFLNSICSSTARDNYIHKIYRSKQPKQFTRALQTTSHYMAATKKGKCKTTTKDSGVGIEKANLTESPNTKAAKNTGKKQRNCKWTASYSNMSIPEAEERLKLSLNLPGIPVKRMLEGKSVLLGPDLILRVKRKIYEGLVDYLKVAGYPTEADPDFKEANINDIVVLTIYPLLALFQDETPRNLRLSREKEIASKDSSTSGMEEFVVMDCISYNEKQYVLIVEAKKVSLGQARKQCFLAMKDMWDRNGGGTVYGFVTMGDSWRMVSYDGTFKMSNKIELLFDTMGEEEEGWMANYSILIDCFNVALSHGGKDPVKVV